MSASSLRAARYLVCLMLALALPHAGAATRCEKISARMGPADGAVVVENHQTICILGALSPSTALAFADLIRRSPATTTVLLDSPGGDMASAIDIATLIQRQRLDVIVDGRCFSACANYLFPAGQRKTVNRFSFLGIHNRTYHYVDGGVSKQTADRDAWQAAAERGDRARTRLAAAQLLAKELRFLRDAHYTPELDNAFTAYLRRHEQVLASKAPPGASQQCPDIKLWILSRSQVEKTGMQHVDQFWEPATAEEKRLIQIYFKLPLKEVFFGSVSALESLCAN